MKKNILSKLVIFSLLLTVSFALSVNIQAQDSKAKKLVKQADSLYNKRQYQEAISKYAEAIELSPNYPYAHFWKGYSHSFLMEFDKSKAELDKAFEQGYNKLDIYKVRWNVNYQLADYDDALNDATEGLKLDPAALLFKTALADIYYGQKDYTNALKYYSEIVGEIPVNGDVYYFIADSQYNLGKTEEQVVNAQKAIEKTTKYVAEAHFLIGDAMMKSRKYDEAVPAFQKSKNLKPKNYAIYRNLGEIYRSQSRFKEAIAIAKEGLLLFPKDAGLYVDLSWYQSLDGQSEAAIGSAERALVFDANQSMAYTNICRGYNSLGKYAKAKTACNKALELNPGDGETNLYLGFVYQGLGEKDEAKKYFEKAVEGLYKYTTENPDYSDSYYLLGSAYYSTEQTKKAIEAYQRSLELSPRFARAHFNLGVAYFVDQQQDLADKQYSLLLDLDKKLAEDLKGIIKK